MSEPSDGQQKPASAESALGTATLSRAARRTKFWFIVPAVLLSLGIAGPLALGGSTAATTGAVPKPVTPPIKVPVDFVLTSKTLVAANCKGSGALVGIEDSKITYQAGTSPTLSTTLGNGKLTGKVCTYSAAFEGAKEAVYGKVKLSIEFPFADPLSFDFAVDANTPSITVRLTLD